ncbi:hypothetical protein Mal48_15940 [Thalassoglobus polymorphus]|uniref:Uncharacterized protein n=1 Tax=Thalassoglobus polymorphus TaxID=2527994 RepID=A0A517QL25_9PLAN|nr:hypothetical protein Mal48_15940 [Thalassoglobus polymorphus]
MLPLSKMSQDQFDSVGFTYEKGTPVDFSWLLFSLRPRSPEIRATPTLDSGSVSWHAVDDIGKGPFPGTIHIENELSRIHRNR